MIEAKFMPIKINCLQKNERKSGVNQAQPAINPSSYSSFAEQSLALLRKQSPVIKRTLDNYGSVSLADYLRQTLSICPSPLQSRNDLLEAVYRYAGPLLGERVAEKVAKELLSLPAVLTVNHHGVDFLAQSVQSSLLFSLREVGGKPATTVPVFACGNIALNNPTYPRGLLLYDVDWKAPSMLPVRLPILPDRWKRMSVSLVGAYDADMLARTKKYLAAIVKNRKISPVLAIAAQKILDQDYRNSVVTGLKSYSEQVVILNNRIWKRCFREPESAPELVYLELEKITSLLLQGDLNNQDSLIWQIMFNPTLRAKVISLLDGARACWDRGKINRRSFPTKNNNISKLSNCGTIFFWAIDDAGWRIPLVLAGDGTKSAVLLGRDDGGKLWTFPFNPATLIQELRTGRLLPSLFTCYSTIAFARGMSCCGGYFQADYLFNIRHALARALSETMGEMGFADRVAQVPSDIYLSGMQAVMRNSYGDYLLPAGPVEMIASGGLSRDQLKQVRSLTVRDAHVAGLMESLPDFFYKDNLPDSWWLVLVKEYSRLLKDRILVI